MRVMDVHFEDNGMLFWDPSQRKRDQEVQGGRFPFFWKHKSSTCVSPPVPLSNIDEGFSTWMREEVLKRAFFFLLCAPSPDQLSSDCEINGIP